MRKYIIGILIGFVLATGTSAYAEVSTIIGKAVEGVFPVKVNGTKVEKEAIVIEGTSYLPVRAIGDALGMEVGFDADLGITLSAKPQTLNSNQTTNEVIKSSSSQEVISIVTKPFRKVKVITDKTHDIEQSDTMYAEVDGIKYVSAAVLSTRPYNVEWSNPYATFTDENGVQTKLEVVATYQTGCDGFTVDGTSVFNLAKLGLTAHIDGETLVIEKQS